MLSLWCRTNGSRPSAVGAALGGERSQGVACHRYDRAVYLTAKEASPKQASPVTVISKRGTSRRDVVIAFSIRALSPTQAYKRAQASA